MKKTILFFIFLLFHIHLLYAKNYFSAQMANITEPHIVFFILTIFAFCLIHFFIVKKIKKRYQADIEKVKLEQQRNTSNMKSFFYENLKNEILPLSNQTLQPIKYLYSEKDYLRDNSDIEKTALTNAQKLHLSLLNLLKPFNNEFENETETSTNSPEEFLLKEKNKEDLFYKSIAAENKKVSFINSDQRLLENVIKHIRTNIENPDLNVETMSKELGISRTHLHRKIKKIIGKSPVDLIISIRMEQAAALLRNGNLSISEVGYKVGYNTPSYFSSSFNSYYGMTPTIFMEKQLISKEFS